MLKRVVSIAGKPGLYRLVSQGKNMLIVEALADGKRIPAYMRDKVMSLGDISIYTLDGDVPLAEVMQKVLDKTQGKPVDVKALGADSNIREFFGEILPNFDNERVHTTDIKKLFSWYNILVNAGFDKFVEEEAPAAEETPDEKNAE